MSNYIKHILANSLKEHHIAKGATTTH
uniref:Uncharacterized protein n=1 Tax=Arundo donax TaxID=35708 RepID=A0A0A9HHB2_ARUDO